MSDDTPDHAPPSGPPQRQGLSTGCLVALAVLAILLMGFGICVAVVFSGWV